MSILAVVGVLLIVLAIVHIVPLVLGLVLGFVLLVLGGGAYVGRGRRGPW